MNDLANWLRGKLQRQGLTQGEAAVYAGVGQATISDMLNKGHVPKVETLFRLADYFETPRDEVLRLAGHLPPATGDDTPAGIRGEDEALIRELVAEFRRVPDEWKAVAIEQVAQFRRLAELRPVRLIGEGEEMEAQGSRDAREEEERDEGRDAAHAA
jgi:transcriptional regulator with XRE-family HTH domain